MALPLLISCGRSEPALVELAQRPTATGVRLTLIAAAGVHINALLQPVLERPDGTVLRFDAPERSADSAYFVSAPTLDLLPPIAGVVRASVCSSEELVCRQVTLEVRNAY